MVALTVLPDKKATTVANWLIQVIRQHDCELHVVKMLYSTVLWEAVFFFHLREKLLSCTTHLPLVLL